MTTTVLRATRNGDARSRLRFRASDALGKPLLADFETDAQLQRGILEILGLMKGDARAVEAYRGFVDKKFEAPKSVDDETATPEAK